jgi:enterochelin esterase family protein
MGGGQTLQIGPPNLDKFGYIGVFSAGPRNPADFEKQNEKFLTNPDTKKLLKLFWIGAGATDMALPGAKALSEVLNKHGIQNTFRQSPGGHTWINWRHYLAEFAPLLFR